MVAHVQWRTWRVSDRSGGAGMRLSAPVEVSDNVRTQMHIVHSTDAMSNNSYDLKGTITIHHRIRTIRHAVVDVQQFHRTRDKLDYSAQSKAAPHIFVNA